MTADGEPGLTAEEMRLAVARIAGWRVAPEAPVDCPRCGRDGLVVADRSARPYAEWYALSCAACGLETTIQIPMAPPAP